MDLQIEKLQNAAIDAAIKNNWDKAITMNNQILGLDKDNLDATLALGYAMLQSGNLEAARKSYKHALQLDPTNVIARNNLDKILVLLKGPTDGIVKEIKLDPNAFMNVRGRTKVITLLMIGQAQALANLHVGEEVELKEKKRRLEVRTKTGEYIGALPDDISKRLMFFLESGCTYSVIIKASTKNSVDVFVKEDKLGKKVRNYVSFPDNIQDDMRVMIGKDEDMSDGAAGQRAADGDSGDDDDEGDDLLEGDLEVSSGAPRSNQSNNLDDLDEMENDIQEDLASSGFHETTGDDEMD